MENSVLEADDCGKEFNLVSVYEEPEHAFSRVVAGFVVGVAQYKARARRFYFEVVLLNLSCPLCGDKLSMAEAGKAVCGCGHRLDPTLSFQKSRCCGAKLVRRSLHYACGCCGRAVPSRFLFDERVFDKAYFRQRMAESRARAKERRELMRLARREERSRGLTLVEEPKVDVLPGFSEALNAFIGFDTGVWSHEFQENPDYPALCAYREHILRMLARYHQVMFSKIDPLIQEQRKDRVLRFVAVIFLVHDGEVRVTQYSSDIGIELPYDETD